MLQRATVGLFGIGFGAACLVLVACSDGGAGNPESLDPGAMATPSPSATGQAKSGLTCSAPSDALKDEAYQFSFEIAGGTAPYAVSEVTGLPPGLELNGLAITGTPTRQNEGVDGYLTSWRVTDAAGLTQDFSAHVRVRGPAWAQLTPPTGQVNAPFEAKIYTNGLIASFSPPLPEGLSWHPSIAGGTLAGTISGTPTTPGKTTVYIRMGADTYSAVIEVR
jgi:hypothetical protein